ncbi:MAG: acyl-CoA dehydratase activase [Pseudomonadota bacterium]
MITAGVDVGSLTGKTVILKDNEILAWNLIPTGPDSSETAAEVFDMTLKETGLTMDDIEYIVSTGYGRVVVPFSNKNITEITCHAKGANWFFPSVRLLLDMGGQDCKAIRCDETGKVTNFAMNDKCAAGAGRSMEIMSELLDTPLAEMGALSLDIKDKLASLSSTCVVFARTEVLGYLHEGVHKNDILAGACEALADRVYTLLKRVGFEGDFVISGGIAKNIGVVKRIEEKVGLKANICFEPQIVGALGAAVFGREILEKKAKKK